MTPRLLPDRWHLYLIALVVMALGLVIPFAVQAGNLIKSVSVAPEQLDLSKNEPVVISWQQIQGGRLDAMICNLDGKVVKHIHNREEVAAGAHQVSWDGRDDKGNPCPNGAYLPVF